MAEKSCDVGNTANTNEYIKTDNNDSNPDGGSNIKRVSSKSISKLQGSSNKNSNNVCLLPSCFTVLCIVEFKLEIILDQGNSDE